jgi:hypothetical protein
MKINDEGMLKLFYDESSGTLDDENEVIEICPFVAAELAYIIITLIIP